MMKIDFNDATPVYQQIIDAFKRQIFGGHMQPGQRLPSVRELSEQLEVNPNTLQKSLAELERDGLVKARRTSGRFVTTDSGEIFRQRQQMLDDIIGRFAAQLAELGCGYDEVTAIVSSMYAQPQQAPYAPVAEYAPAAQPAPAPAPQYSAGAYAPQYTQEYQQPPRQAYQQPTPQPLADFLPNFAPEATIDDDDTYTGARPYRPKNAGYQPPAPSRAGGDSPRHFSATETVYSPSPAYVLEEEQVPQPFANSHYGNTDIIVDDPLEALLPYGKKPDDR